MRPDVMGPHPAIGGRPKGSTMFITHRARRGRLAAALLLSTTALVAGGLMSGGGGANAADEGHSAKQQRLRQYVNTYDHPMGSQIRKHESTRDMPMVVHP